MNYSKAGEASKETLQPLCSDGALHVTHTASLKGEFLTLEPSKASKSFVLACFALGGACFIAMVYLLFALQDLFGAFALSVGFFTLFCLGLKIRKGEQTFVFSGSRQELSGFKEIIHFSEITQIELLKKIVGGRTQKEPFQSGEMRILTKSGTRYLLVQGGNHALMTEIATTISSHINTPLHIDKNVHKT